MFQHLFGVRPGYFVAKKGSRVDPSSPRIDFEVANEGDFV